MAASLAMFGVALAPSAGATTTVTTSRLQGTSRYGTAKAVSADASLAGGTVALVASGEDAHLADSLAASSLAGANAPAPIVLTQTDTYTQDAKDALAALKAKGVTTVFVVGGTSAVTATVFDAIKADGFTTTRVSDVDRFGTAAAVATAAKAKKALGTTGTLPTAIIASGFSYADALAASPMAYSQNFPVLLVNPDSVPAATTKAITDLGIKKVIIAGGTVPVSTAVQTSLETQTGNPALRIGGVDRNDTAAQLGDYEIGTLAYPATSAVLANGIRLVDALAVGPFAGQNKAPIVLTASLPAASKAFLDKYSNRIQKLVVAGGTAAISDADVTGAQSAAQTVSNDTGAATSAPELTKVEFVNVTTTGGSASAGQVLVRYTFDEPILASPLVQGSFKVYNAVGDVQSASSVARDTANSSAVLAVFDIAGGGSFAAIEQSVFTVASGAVQDSDGKVNPEGDLPGFTANTFAPGITRNPDLTGVAVVTADTVYDFTFDGNTQVLSPTGFRMVDSDGSVRPSTLAVVQTGATSTSSTIRVTFAAPATSITGVRGVVLEAAVSSSASALGTTPQEAADVAGTSGSSDSPDLVSVTVDSANNRATFTFDENVETLSSGNRQGFHLYYRLSSGSNADVPSVSADRSTTDLRSIVAQFAAGTTNELVAGGYVDNASVFRDQPSTDVATTTAPNRVDEEGVGSSFAAGAYIGPNLVTATRANTTNVFGTVTGSAIKYTFDQAVTLNASTGFFVIGPDGTRTNLTSCAMDTAVTANTTVSCTLSTTGAEATAASASVVATVISDAVRSAKSRITGLGSITVGNHEERSTF